MQGNLVPNLSRKIFFIADVEVITGRNRSTLRRWWTLGKFPTPIKLHGTVMAWHADSLENWIDQNLQVSHCA